MKKMLISAVLCLVALVGAAAIGPQGSEKSFDSGAVAVTNAVLYVEVARIQADGRPILVQVDVGSGGAIAEFMVAQSVLQGATTRPLASNTDFATPTVAVPYVLGSAVHTTAAGGSFQVKLDSGAGDYVVYAKKSTTDTTVRVSGRVL